MINEPWVRLCLGHQLSHIGRFWSFLDYYSLFWGPGVISTIDEPRGAFTCRSSTLAVFVDSDPFHGLLLNIGVSKRFPWLSNPGVPTLAVLADSRPFVELLLTILGPRRDFHSC